MIFKIASWNVNSVRARLSHLLAWLQEQHPDLLALQETKVCDELFPIQQFTDIGYHCVYSGQQSYNGVALISKTPLTAINAPGLSPMDSDKRVLLASCQELRIVNVYVPNGAALDSPKYPAKIAWLSALAQLLTQELVNYPKMLVLGDFNIAPAPQDTYNPDDVGILCSPAEREQFGGLLNLGFADAYRHHYPDNKEYTWWDYRQNAFKRNLGMRIDHIIMSKALTASSVDCIIDRTPRTWPTPSDHTPIIASFTL